MDCWLLKLAIHLEEQLSTGVCWHGWDLLTKKRELFNKLPLTKAINLFLAFDFYGLVYPLDRKTQTVTFWNICQGDVPSKHVVGGRYVMSMLTDLTHDSARRDKVYEGVK
jgi:hypothetical protein